MPLLGGTRVVVLDTETTGFDARAHVLVEVARVDVVDGAIADTWSSLLQPGRPIPPDASAVHGITDAMVAEAPAPAAVAGALRRACGDDPVVFHNAPFDLPFLARLFAGARQPALLSPVIDTLGLARGVINARSHALGALAEQLGLPRESRHRALGDALTTARLLLLLVERWERERGVTSLAELAAASQDVVRLTARR